MKKLWEYPDEQQRDLVAASLDKYGELIGEMSSPHSSIYTFDLGERASPRYVVAKGIRVNSSMREVDIHQYIARALYEVNNAFSVCHHPLIQRFFEVKVIFGVPFLLSRKRDATLRDIIAEGPLSEVEALSIAIRIVHALKYAESKGLLCHQDLKPENIFMDITRNRFAVREDYPFEYLVTVADFELANAYIALRHPFGSRPYMAPEQYSGMSQESLPDFSRVDVFALGVMLFEMISGGFHPIGERTSLIWPDPAEGKSRKWLREDPWKQWLKNGASISHNSALRECSVSSIIRNCLETDFSKRPSKETLESYLLEALGRINVPARKLMDVTLEHFDRLAAEGEQGGWPYYEERLQQLNDAYRDGM